jgi:hypothetical protein
MIGAVPNRISPAQMSPCRNPRSRSCLPRNRLSRNFRHRSPNARHSLDLVLPIQACLRL